MLLPIQVTRPPARGAIGAQAATGANAGLTQIMALQKQLLSLEKELKSVQDGSSGYPSAALADLETQLAQQINAVQQEIQKLQQSTLQKSAAQQLQAARATPAQGVPGPATPRLAPASDTAPYAFNGVPGVILATRIDGQGEHDGTTGSAPTTTLGSVIQTQA